MRLNFRPPDYHLKPSPGPKSDLNLPVSFASPKVSVALIDLGEGLGLTEVLSVAFGKSTSKGGAVTRPRILLADDHKEMRDRIKRHLELEFDVIAAVENGRTLLEAAARFNPDICLLDISMPVLNGIETAIQLRQSGSKAKVLFLTIHEDPDFLDAALRTGASGYVLKRRMASDLRPAIRDVLAGKTFISSSAVFPDGRTKEH